MTDPDCSVADGQDSSCTPSQNVRNGHPLASFSVAVYALVQSYHVKTIGARSVGVQPLHIWHLLAFNASCEEVASPSVSGSRCLRWALHEYSYPLAAYDGANYQNSFGSFRLPAVTVHRTGTRCCVSVLCTVAVLTCDAPGIFSHPVSYYLVALPHPNIAPRPDHHGRPSLDFDLGGKPMGGAQVRTQMLV